MPPKPTTRTEAPGPTRAVSSAAPTPVCTAQPITQTTSRGTSGSTLMAPDAGITAYSAKPATPTPR